MNNCTNQLKSIIKKEANEADWLMHIKPVIDISHKLAEKLEANIEIVEVAALLHDIGRIRFGPENHEITGAQEAKIILENFKLDEIFISKVIECIETHSNKGDRIPNSLEAKILSNSDAVSHINAVPYFFYSAGLKGEPLTETIIWVNKKIRHDWEKKLTLPEARDIVQDRYAAANLLLKSINDLVE